MHHLVLIDAKLGGIQAGKGSEGEGPAVQAGGEAHSSLLRVDLQCRQEGHESMMSRIPCKQEASWSDPLTDSVDASMSYSILTA